MKAAHSKPFLWVSLAICLAGCTPPAANVPQIVQSKDKRVEATLPRGWETAALLGASDRFIQGKCSAKNAYVEVVHEPKQDFNHKSVREYAKVILGIQGKRSKLANRTVSPQKELKVSGADAVQFEVRGTLNNVNVVYLETFIETPSYWTHVSEWTTPSHWNDVQDDFRAIYESLAEVPKMP
jgi:hypothetical protein